MVKSVNQKVFPKERTLPFVVCADAQNYSRHVSQLTLHSSHHQTEYSFGGGLPEVWMMLFAKLTKLIKFDFLNTHVINSPVS
ncbi:hypothetical protein CUN59_14295 [Cuspidothrix issatschenkoi CHARLIE-1]|uniref:Uncharacterized protein n=1 Tax=Cuspidothrix issatschenkoi CHARLIE-1 TaxID=2052836 RepID=A0A2S6CSB6_9CYAN|nr:hypothetical protein CUN59_14295 [Cuspidothrix issatschenkoi CHARLIE-1]